MIQSRNIVFNAGCSYALSKESLRRLVPVFESQAFQNPPAAIQRRGQSCLCLCINRRGAFEDPAMGICLHSLGIDPINTVDSQNRERFSPFKEGYHYGMGRGDWWYFKEKYEKIGLKTKCCSPNMISFHFYKDQPKKHYKEMHARYNIKEGEKYVSNSPIKNQRDVFKGQIKTFSVPQPPSRFLHSTNLTFEFDPWRNVKNIPKQQHIYIGPGNERTCYNC